ncbi:DUF3558 domain-containing protein [Amycolatopsis rhizosphaerae]|uniref:DUF3558 domain-containing protein n=1 Tax=Amycolatopsis rhizosphaerae TaxID=2053003 RepID=A0A558DPP9_9PSEU|nr:DUF3558 family protein [Amycolatopsis rhizosphaerae]TVT62976.1 DUF3558 domain-containing protein [Amycolatopsis rhizosphaerae]
MRGRIAVAGSLLLATACTTAVPGTPHPQTGRVTKVPAASTDPCSVITNDEAAAAGLSAPGEPKPGRPESRVPPGCVWHSGKPDGSTDDEITVFYSTDLPVGDYYPSRPDGHEQFGGITWDHYRGPLGDVECDLAVTLSSKSFLALSGQNYADPAKACDVVRKIAPIVAGHLAR